MLQSTPALTAPVTWHTETTSPDTSGTNHIFLVYATNTARFFRLTQQN
ncbi:MAG TPA: hypothetical protein PKI20_14070 [Verrucomicrobiota bacterium]|nr:hypothetical protein [Verrucomicrobiota bacterium]HQL79048.1 hypothetical protein [Verrucomicrobiota bacterium]